MLGPAHSFTATTIIDVAPAAATIAAAVAAAAAAAGNAAAAAASAATATATIATAATRNDTSLAAAGKPSTLRPRATWRSILHRYPGVVHQYYFGSQPSVRMGDAEEGGQATLPAADGLGGIPPAWTTPELKAPSTPLELGTGAGGGCGG